MSENQNLTLEEVLRQLEEAKKRIVLLEEKVESKELEITQQSEKINQ